MSNATKFALIGATVGACFGYAMASLFGFDCHIGIVVGTTTGAFSSAAGE